MKPLNIRLGLLAFGTAAALLSTNAHAVWTFDGAVPADKKYAASVGSDPSVTLSGFSAGNNTTTGVVTGTWADATLASWTGSGLGVKTGAESSPDHAIDNNGSTESVLLNFGTSKVALSSIGLGWVANNSTTSSQCGTGVTANAAKCLSGGVQNSGISVDLSVFRWIGKAGETPPNLATKSATSLTSSGWELVGNYDMGVDQTAVYNTINSGGVSSSWWLISAYNSGLTTGMTAAAVEAKRFGTVDNGADYFKLYAVAGTVTNRVPEPASLALASAALLGVAGLRRRTSKMTA